MPIYEEEGRLTRDDLFEQRKHNKCKECGGYNTTENSDQVYWRACTCLNALSEGEPSVEKIMSELESLVGYDWIPPRTLRSIDKVLQSQGLKTDTEIAKRVIKDYVVNNLDLEYSETKVLKDCYDWLDQREEGDEQK